MTTCGDGSAAGGMEEGVAGDEDEEEGDEGRWGAGGAWGSAVLWTTDMEPEGVTREWQSLACYFAGGEVGAVHAAKDHVARDHARADHVVVVRVVVRVDSDHVEVFHAGVGEEACGLAEVDVCGSTEEVSAGLPLMNCSCHYLDWSCF